MQKPCPREQSVAFRTMYGHGIYIVAGGKWNRIMYVSLFYWKCDQDSHTFIISREFVQLKIDEDCTYAYE